MLELKSFAAAWSAAEVSFGNLPFHLVIIFDGSGSAAVNGCKLRVSPGSVFFIREGSLSQVDWKIGHGLAVSFGAGELDYFLLQSPASRRLCLFSQTITSVLDRSQLVLLESRLGNVAFELEHGNSSQQMMAFSIALMSITAPMAGDMVQPAVAPSLYKKFSGFLEENFRCQRRARVYADHLAVTMKKLNSLCRLWYGGSSFRQVLDQRLLREAELMLRAGELPIKVIAYELGFCSMQHFRGYLKKAKGMSPTMFRQAMQGKVDP